MSDTGAGTAAGGNYRILAIDGGGLRGVIPLAILERLDAAVPGWRAGIHMCAGTSTGGLIALGLAKSLAPKDLMNVYMDDGPAIFSRSAWRELKSVENLIGPKYDSAHRERACKRIFGDARLGDLRSADGERGHVVIASFDLDDRANPDPSARRWKAKIFHNLPTADGSGDELEFAYRVAMRTSAAPTFFASYDGFVDGGVFANNPSMCALAQTQDRRLARPVALATVKILSIGTGVFPERVAGEASWGLWQWAPRLVELLMDGVNEVAEFETREILGARNFHRVSVRLQTDIALDDASELGNLQRIGNSADLDAAIEFVRRW